MIFDWNEEKNEKLKLERGISFEEILNAIWDDKIIDILPSANIEKYPNQQQFVINFNGYPTVVPFVKDEAEWTIFLKTIIQSRKLKKKYSHLLK